MARWYDKHKRLAVYLEMFKEMEPDKRDELIKGIMVLIKENNPTLLDDFVMDFPMELQRRRWYDKDPYLWIIFNGLKYADRDLIEEVVKYFEKNEKSEDL